MLFRGSSFAYDKRIYENTRNNTNMRSRLMPTDYEICVICGLHLLRDPDSEN